MSPDWPRSAVFYQIFPDRFFRSERVESFGKFENWDSPQTPRGFKGGNLPGVADKLDYLSDLGVNALYLNPVFKSCANHRYHTYDYFEVDPLLGGNEALRELLDTAHARGIRVILDGVFNHCGRGFFQFNHLLENGEASPYKDWFHASGFPLKAYDLAPGEKTNYGCWWGLPELPKFNTGNPQVRRLIFEAARHWLRFGIDGWRLDVPFEIDDDSFWREFRSVCKGASPDCYLVGEIWDDARRWLKGDMFDATMNYLLPVFAMRYFAGDKLRLSHSYGGHALTPIGEKTFKAEIAKLSGLYENSAALSSMNILSTHDTDRMLTAYGGDEKLMRLGLIFTFFYPGAPNVYYGEELGLSGVLENGTRQGMPWDEGRWNTGLLDLYRKCIRLRRTRPVLASGGFKLLDVPGAEDVIAYERSDEKSRICVVLNKSGRSQRARIIWTFGKGKPPIELIASSAHAFEAGDEFGIALEPYGYSVIGS